MERLAAAALHTTHSPRPPSPDPLRPRLHPPGCRTDGKHVVFGRVTEGMPVVRRIEGLGSKSGRTSQKIYIQDCGEVGAPSSSFRVARCRGA